jgi:hypothetical protein
LCISSSRFPVFIVFRPFEAASKVLSENIPTARAVVIKDTLSLQQCRSITS